MSKVTFMPYVVSSITDIHTTTSVLLACLVLVIMATFSNNTKHKSSIKEFCAHVTLDCV